MMLRSSLSPGQQATRLIVALVLLLQGLVGTTLAARAQEAARLDAALGVICLTDPAHQDGSGQPEGTQAPCEHPCCLNGRSFGSADLPPFVPFDYVTLWAAPLAHRLVFAIPDLVPPPLLAGDGHIGARAPPFFS